LETSDRLIARDVQEPEYQEEKKFPELMPEDVLHDDIEVKTSDLDLQDS